MVPRIVQAAAVALLIFSAATRAEILRDDFDTLARHWEWIEEGAGAHIAVGGGICTLQLSSPVAGRYCNAELVNLPHERYRYGSFTIRCKADRMMPGSRGWGLWDRNKLELPYDFDMAWVMQSDDYTADLGTNWLRWGHCQGAMEMRVWRDLSSIVSPEQWHTYRMVWSPESIALYIDDIPIAASADQVPDEPMSMDIWVDNQSVGSFGPTFVYHSWDGVSRLLVDYVEIDGNRVKSSPSQAQDVRLGPKAIRVVGGNAAPRRIALPYGFTHGWCVGYSVDGRRVLPPCPIRPGDTIRLTPSQAGIRVLHLVGADAGMSIVVRVL